MKIQEKNVVGMHYTLKNDKGEVIDSSAGAEPLHFLFGTGFIIPGLEKELEGKVKGDKVTAVVKPEEAYGELDENLRQELPKTQFEAPEGIQPGMQFEVDTEVGMLVVTVTEVKDDTVVIDGNHPLAGETLHFEVEITEVREATEEEIAHNHVHTPGMHHHD